MAPTIIRVKRKIEEVQEVDSKIVLNCKKQRVNEKDVYSQFSFVGTVDEKQDIIPDHILKLTKKEAENIVQNKSKELNSSLTNRVTENLEKCKEKRFKVVNFLRSTKELQAEPTPVILDVENEDDQNSTERSQSYVYDIYVGQDTDFSAVLKDDMIDLNDLSILDYNDYLYSCPRLTNDTEELDDNYDEDSNDENNWRNDYPDEEDFSDASSMDERAMRRAMQDFELDNELSSDYNEDIYNDSKNDFISSIDTEEYGFDGDYDYGKAGSGYRKYKKKLMRDLECDSENTTDSDE